MDTAWRHDPFAEVDRAGSHELYIIDDDAENRGFAQWYFCTCFLYLQPTTTVKTLVQAWGEHMYGHNDQPVFNKILHSAYNHSSVDFAVLPFAKMPPGERIADSPGPVVVHANYLIGHTEKVDFMCMNGLWTGDCGNTTVTRMLGTPQK